MNKALEEAYLKASFEQKFKDSEEYEDYGIVYMDIDIENLYKLQKDQEHYANYIKKKRDTYKYFEKSLKYPVISKFPFFESRYYKKNKKFFLTFEKKIKELYEKNKINEIMELVTDIYKYNTRRIYIINQAKVSKNYFEFLETKFYKDYGIYLTNDEIIIFLNPYGFDPYLPTNYKEMFIINKMDFHDGLKEYLVNNIIGEYYSPKKFFFLTKEEFIILGRTEDKDEAARDLFKKSHIKNLIPKVIEAKTWSDYMRTEFFKKIGKSGAIFIDYPLFKGMDRKVFIQKKIREYNELEEMYAEILKCTTMKEFLKSKMFKEFGIVYSGDELKKLTQMYKLKQFGEIYVYIKKKKMSYDSAYKNFYSKTRKTRKRDFDFFYAEKNYEVDREVGEFLKYKMGEKFSPKPKLKKLKRPIKPIKPKPKTFYNVIEKLEQEEKMNKYKREMNKYLSKLNEYEREKYKAELEFEKLEQEKKARKRAYEEREKIFFLSEEERRRRGKKKERERTSFIEGKLESFRQKELKKKKEQDYEKGTQIFLKQLEKIQMQKEEEDTNAKFLQIEDGGDVVRMIT